MSAVKDIKAAMEVLCDMPCGGIGGDGWTMEEIDAVEQTGHPAENDATYHQAQKAWLLLDRALSDLESK